jgi:flagellar basal body L-ring protein FlgH
MKLFGLTIATALLALCSCAEAPEKKPVGPTSETSKIPWNTQVPGQGMGQFGMMPQNQYRR